MTFLRSRFFYTTFALYALVVNFLFLSIDSEAEGIPTLKNQTQNSILYEVSGNGLTQPSYIFGTIHILNQSYIDSFPVINQKCPQTHSKEKHRSNLTPRKLETCVSKMNYQLTRKSFTKR